MVEPIILIPIHNWPLQETMIGLTVKYTAHLPVSFLKIAEGVAVTTCSVQRLMGIIERKKMPVGLTQKQSLGSVNEMQFV
uniref:Uncharacterized protein n=1 Tax=Arundo donax TaxID=35708 RepID=A0A0A9ESL1_ARUDO